MQFVASVTGAVVLVASFAISAYAVKAGEGSARAFVLAAGVTVLGVLITGTFYSCVSPS